MKYIVLYSAGCAPMIRTFDTRAQAIAWVGEFTLKYAGNEDYWVDGLIKGTIEHMTLDTPVVHGSNS